MKMVNIRGDIAPLGFNGSLLDELLRTFVVSVIAGPLGFLVAALAWKQGLYTSYGMLAIAIVIPALLIGRLIIIVTWSLRIYFSGKRRRNA